MKTSRMLAATLVLAGLGAAGCRDRSEEATRIDGDPTVLEPTVGREGLQLREREDEDRGTGGAGEVEREGARDEADMGELQRLEQQRRLEREGAPRTED